MRGRFHAVFIHPCFSPKRQNPKSSFITDTSVSTHLESLNALDLLLHIITLQLVPLHLPLDLINHGCVLQHIAVVLEIDGLRLLGQDLHSSPRIVVALLEVGEGLCGAASQSEVRADAGPVDFGGGAGLKVVSESDAVWVVVVVRALPSSMFKEGDCLERRSFEEV